MRTFLLMTVATLAFVSPSQARDYPWCSQPEGIAGSIQCGYVTLRQCQAAVSGVGGFCIRNPYLAFQEQNGRKKR